MVRTRFAPSPTGYLHIGSLRTALFAYLAARSQQGKVILRIEDTDQKRYVEGAVAKIIDILEWVGIKFDEGPHVGGKFGPYIQSQRKSIYDQYSRMLLEKGAAYYCFCTPERLAKMRAEQAAKKMPPRYDRACRELKSDEVKKRLAQSEPAVIRQKMPTSGEIIAYDELRGDIKFQAQDLEDHILIKSDGMPTYHCALVVDDYLMKITHVIRGEEWLPSFPKNILLYKSFGWTPPKFYHLPLTLNKGGGKLSKRQGDAAVEDYRAKGYLPEALLNFSVLLGWHPDDDNEILTLPDLDKKFRVENLGTSPAIFDLEKLDYFNGYYIRHKDLDDLTLLCLPYLSQSGLVEIMPKAKCKNKDASSAGAPQIAGSWQSHGNVKYKNKITGELMRFDYLRKIIGLEQERLKKLSEIGELVDFFFKAELDYPAELLIWKKIGNKQIKSNLEILLETLEKINENKWNKNGIEKIVMDFIKNNDYKIGDYLWPMRVALTGRQASPGPFEVAEVLGKTKSLDRIKSAIEKI